MKGNDRDGLIIESFVNRQTCPKEKIWIISAPEEEVIANILARCLSDLGRFVDVGTLSTFKKVRIDEYVHVVSFSTKTPDELHPSVDRWAWQLGLPWTPCTFKFTTMQLDIGPVFRREYTPTFEALSKLYGLHRGAHVADAVNGPEIAFGCNIVARSLLFFDSSARGFYPAQGWIRHDLRKLSTRYNRTVCPSFASDSSNESQVDLTIAAPRLFEAYAAPEEPSVLSTQKTARSSSSRYIARSLQPVTFPHSSKRFLQGARSLPESTVQQLLRAPNAQSVRWDSSTLSSLLLYGAGVRTISPVQDAVKRYAASAGNLGSCELGVFDIGSGAVPPGLYRHRSVRHDLAQVQSRRWKEIECALESHLFGEPGISGQLAIFLCGKLKRLCGKYGALGYKLMYLDAGVMFSQLKLVAHAFGLSLQLAPDLNRKLPGEALQLAHEDAELVGTAILTSQRGIACVTHDNGILPILSSESTSDGLLLSADAIVHELSKGVWLLPHQQRSGLESPAGSQWRQSEPVTLLCKEDARMSLTHVLQRRASIRKVSAEAVPEETICELLSLAHRADKDEWSCVTTTSINFFVLDCAASRDERRLFRFDPTFGALAECILPKVAVHAPSLYADTAFQAGPKVIWALGDLAAATRERGVRGHQELLMRAGAALNRIWLLGIAKGLCGCMSAGVLARTAQRELGFDGWNQLPISTLLLGRRCADQENVRR